MDESYLRAARGGQHLNVSRRTWCAPRRANGFHVGILWLACASEAYALGVEDTVGGTVALGRGANYARVNDFMATWQNPANLTLTGRDSGLDVTLPIFHACFDRVPNTITDADEDERPGVTYPPYDSFAEECNHSGPFPIGNGGFTLPVLDSLRWGRLSVGAGIFTPAGVSKLAFGDDRIITVLPQENETLPITTTGTASANRYLLLNRLAISAWASVAAAWAPIERVRIGAMFGWGYANIKFKNVASLVQGFTDQQLVNDVGAVDWFIPRVTVSVAATPIDAVDLMASFTWTDDLSADGQVDVTANGVQGAPLDNCRSANPGPRCRVENTTLNVPYQNFELVVGGRYGMRRAGSTREKPLDTLKDELWDIELDVHYARTGNVTDYVLDLYSVPTANPPRVALSSDPAAVPAPLPSRAVLSHHWHDSVAVRIGADYTLLPNVTAARIGLSYESRAVPTNNLSLDYWPVRKIGLHLGASWRIIERVDVHFAYAHLFGETVTVPIGRGALNEVTAIPATKKLGVNEGKFTMSQDIVSLQGNYRF